MFGSERIDALAAEFAAMKGKIEQVWEYCCAPRWHGGGLGGGYGNSRLREEYGQAIKEAVASLNRDAAIVYLLTNEQNPDTQKLALELYDSRLRGGPRIRVYGFGEHPSDRVQMPAHINLMYECLSDVRWSSVKPEETLKDDPRKHETA